MANDAALYELAEGNASDEVDAIVRLVEGATVPAEVRTVSRFGTIATVRLRRRDIFKVRGNPAIASMKAARRLTVESAVSSPSRKTRPSATSAAPSRRPEVRESGAGIVVGVVDWGCDFVHPDFRRRDGGTRLLALWDQRVDTPVTATNPYGRGRIHDTAEIDRAVSGDDPFAALGYDPTDLDTGDGTHGTHVMSIAAGGGFAAPVGVAPKADLVFVELASRATAGLANFGDSVAILEAVDFVTKQAGARPTVINLSMGKHGGPHDGSTLVEMALDHLVRSRPGLVIVNSAGNYYDKAIHTSGRLPEGERAVIDWIVNTADRTGNELEIWYPGDDAFEVSVGRPNGRFSAGVGQDENLDIMVDGDNVGRIYHRSRDPNNGSNHIDIFLYATAPPGHWQVEIEGVRIDDGRFDAWIERDGGPQPNQSRLHRAQVNRRRTIGTIANGRKTITVGAYDDSVANGPVAAFSSSGPTRDGRLKPELAAPGVDILAARSRPLVVGNEPLTTTKSGASMAAPYVAGVVALMLEAAGRPIRIDAVRSLLFDTATPPAKSEQLRAGHGRVNPEAAIAAARRLNSSRLTTQTANQKKRAHAMSEPDDVNATEASAARPSCDPFWQHDRQGFIFDPVGQILPAAISAIDAADVANNAEDFETSLTTPLESQASGQESWPGPGNLRPGTSLLEHAAEAVGADRHDLPTAAMAFDAVVRGRDRDLARLLAGYVIVSRPGESPEFLPQAGDIVITRAVGEGQLASVGRVTGTPSPGHALMEEWTLEIGSDVRPIHGVRPKPLLSNDGRVPGNRLVLRPQISGAVGTADIILRPSKYYSIDPNTHQNPIVRVALDELNGFRVWGHFFDYGRVYREMLAWPMSTRAEAKVLLERIWDDRFADQYLRLHAQMSRDRNKQRLDEFRKLWNEADGHWLREVIEALEDGERKQFKEAFDKGLKIAGTLAQVARHVKNHYPKIAGYLVEKEIISKATAELPPYIWQTYVKNVAIRIGTSILSSPIVMEFGVPALAALAIPGMALFVANRIVVASLRVAYINGFAGYISDLVPRGSEPIPTPDIAKYRSLYSDRRKKERFREGWEFAEKLILPKLNHENPDIAANMIVFLIKLQVEHPDPVERRNFIARRAVIEHGPIGWMYNWRSDNQPGERVAKPRLDD